ERFREGTDLYDWLPDGSGLIVEAADPPPRAAAADPRKRQGLYGDVRRLPAPEPSPSLSRIALAGGQVERLGAAPFAEPGALAVSPDGRWLAIAGSGLSETVETTEVALLPLASSAVPPRTRGAPRQTHNFVLEDRISWAGSGLFATGMGEERGGRFTMTEPRLYRLDPGAGQGGQPAAVRGGRRAADPGAGSERGT